MATGLIVKVRMELISQFILPYWLNLLALFLFALTGALAAIEEGYDIIGVTALALIAGTGGSLIRDGLILQQGVPMFFRDPSFLYAVVLAVMIGIVFRSYIVLHKRPFTVSFLLFDALGLGIFGVVGTQMALFAGLASAPAILTGVINATGGGLLRDVLTAREPLIFKPSQYYAATSLAGCIIFVALALWLGQSAGTAAFIAISLTFFLRALTMWFDWKTKPLIGIDLLPKLKQE
ncbi:MAG: TRIC cation channel family protein [Methanomicrobiales archaeon]